MVRSEKLGRAICPDGRPADLIVEEDGTTWLRVEGMGFKCWANLDKMREPVPVPPVKSWTVRPPSSADLRAGLLVSAYVRDPGFRLGGIV